MSRPGKRPVPPLIINRPFIINSSLQNHHFINAIVKTLISLIFVRIERCKCRHAVALGERQFLPTAILVSHDL